MQAMETQLTKWKESLSKTRKSTFGKLITSIGASQITIDTLENLESLLIQSDIGVKTSLDMVKNIKERVQEDGIIKSEDFFVVVKDELRSRLLDPPQITWEDQPAVILLVGVNGSGKTTSLAKLGLRFQNDGHNIMFAAADTYRAAAVEQLKVWGDRLDIPVISGQKDGDPGAVVFDAVQAAVARKKDLLLIDTAGRLHTKYNLMEELKKVHRVAGKALPGAPHITWLVMDAITGQNALLQAKAFKEAIPIDGVILAKLDSSAKGGMAFAIQEELQLPIYFAGLGEKAEDLVIFQPDAFVSSILNQG